MPSPIDTFNLIYPYGLPPENSGIEFVDFSKPFRKYDPQYTVSPEGNVYYNFPAAEQLAQFLGKTLPTCEKLVEYLTEYRDNLALYPGILPSEKTSLEFFGKTAFFWVQDLQYYVYINSPISDGARRTFHGFDGMSILFQEDLSDSIKKKSFMVLSNNNLQGDARMEMLSPGQVFKKGSPQYVTGKEGDTFFSFYGAIKIASLLGKKLPTSEQMMNDIKNHPENYQLYPGVRDPETGSIIGEGKAYAFWVYDEIEFGKEHYQCVYMKEGGELVSAKVDFRYGLSVRICETTEYTPSIDITSFLNKKIGYRDVKNYGLPPPDAGISPVTYGSEFSMLPQYIEDEWGNVYYNYYGAKRLEIFLGRKLPTTEQLIGAYTKNIQDFSQGLGQYNSSTFQYFTGGSLWAGDEPIQTTEGIILPVFEFSDSDLEFPAWEDYIHNPTRDYKLALPVRFLD